MPRFAFAGWSFGPLLADTLDEARALSFTTDYDQLGDTTAARMARLAEIVNRALSEFLEENVALGQASISVDLPSASGWQRIQGTVQTNTPSSADITGVGTAFTDDLEVGDTVTLYGGEFIGEYRPGYTSDWFEVGTITNNMALIFTSAYAKPATTAIMMRLTSAANARNILIPPDLMGQDIIEVQFNGPNETLIYKYQQIFFLEPGGVQQLPTWVKNDSYESLHPFYCYFNELRNALCFAPWPSSGALSCSIRYRQAPTVLTAADVTTPASIIIGEIPKRFQRVLSLRIAMDLCSTINLERYNELLQMYSTGNIDQPGEMDKAKDLFAKTLASMTQGRQNEAMPDRVVNYHTIFNFSPAGSRRRYVR